MAGFQPSTNGRIWVSTEAEPPIEDLATEFPGLLVTVNDHVPRDLERLGQRRVDSGVTALLEVDYRNTVVIQWPVENFPKRVHKKILSHSLHQYPPAGEEDLSSHSAPVKAKLLLIFRGRKQPAATPQLLYLTAAFRQFRVTAVAIEQAVCGALVEPTTRRNAIALCVPRKGVSTATVDKAVEMWIPRKVGYDWLLQSGDFTAAAAQPYDPNIP